MNTEKVEIKTNHHFTEGILLSSERKESLNVALAHGAGGNMHAPFMKFYQQLLAESGYPCLSFNFPYAHARKKMPDPQPVLISTFRKALDALSHDSYLIGGKSMGGRIASYIADDSRVRGLVFLGYPLHPPGKTEQLRDEHLYSIRKPMFFASGTRDPFAKLEILERVIERIGDFATLHCVEGGGHSFELSKKSDARESEIRNQVGQALLSWISSSVE